MSYDTGNFSLFNQAKNFSTIFADLKAPQFNPPNGTIFGSVWGSYIAPTVLTTGTGSIGTLYGQQTALTLSPTSGTVSSAFSLNISGPAISSGTLTSAYSLFVTPASGAGTIVNNYTASFGGITGFGTTTPKNMLDVQGGMAIGTYAGVFAAPTNGLIISGSLGVATSSPAFTVDVTGIANATLVYASGTTANNQRVALFEGNNQGGFGGGAVGTQKAFNLGTMSSFDLGTYVSSNSVGFWGGVFDGRYVYLVPKGASNATFGGQITRYDTTLPFGSSTSYSVFNTILINSLSKGFQGGIFDGRYVYLIPNSASDILTVGTIIRYDTTLAFGSTSSYAAANTITLVNGNSRGFSGGVFDGQYLYLVPFITTGSAFSGQVTRYDTTLPFTSAGSYSAFDMTTVNSESLGFNGGAFDGRYIYYVPNGSNVPPGTGSTITRYDTTLTFASASSYDIFNSSVFGSLCSNFSGAVFDGRYIYFMPTNFSGAFNAALRYDTALPFGATSSYATFNTCSITSNSRGFQGGIYDGRYVYYVPQGENTYCAVTRYDTTLSFTAASSFTIFNVTPTIGGDARYYGAVFDGRYVYLCPYYNLNTNSYVGIFTRFDAYPGPAATAIAASQAANGFVIGSYAGIQPPTGGLIVSGNVGIGVSSPSVALDVTGGVISATRVYSNNSTFNNQLLGLFEGNNQGGFGGGSVGTNKTMSANTTALFDLSTINSLNTGFRGSVFDGRYIYFVPFSNGLPTSSGQVARYDTTSSFSSSASYAYFDMRLNLNTNSVGFIGGAYDGRYVYFIPNFSNGSYGQLTRYDTTLTFSISTSYSFFDMTANFNTNSNGFFGGVFDGRYLYLVPNTNGQITRYDTVLDFSATTSYSIFNTTTVDTYSKGFRGGVFDGRYVYLVPYYNGSSFSGQITRYDTSLSFSVSTSYAVFDTLAVNSLSQGFWGGVFDGRYVYLVPFGDSFTSSGQITRYDTNLPFSTSTSYSFFDTSILSNNSRGFHGGVFDGRYMYLIPYASGALYTGQITRYDTTAPFAGSASYALFDTTVVNSNSIGFYGAVSDGRYIYLTPNGGSTFSGQVTRIDAYPGPQATAMTAGQAANGFSIGGFSGLAPPTNGLIVSGNVGIGTSSPTVALDVTGGLVSATRTYVPGTTFNNQLVGLFEGNNQGGFGGGFVGLQKTMSANTTAVFDMTQNVNSVSAGFAGGVFDGRFIYYVPRNLATNSSFSGQFTRYDTTLSFQSSSSYTSYNLAGNVNSSSVGFFGGVFDGRYVYLVPGNDSTGTASGQITRYDTTLSFISPGSYSVFNTKILNSNSVGFVGGVFDGTYVYLIPYGPSAGSPFGQFTRYNTQLAFSASASYSTFNLSAVNSNSLGFNGGTYDGRYIYLVPNFDGVFYGQITRYDTTLPFGTATSYAVFDTQTFVNSLSRGFSGAVFDGRYVYLVPQNNGAVGIHGQITRYDTTLSFSNTASYAIFDMQANVNPLSIGYFGAVFDNRYIYYIPFVNVTSSGLITRYDTTQPFASSASYSVFNTKTVSTKSRAFYGGVFDGRYVYLVPQAADAEGTASGQVTRIDAYPGPQATAITAAQSAGGFTIGATIGSPTNGLQVGGFIGIGTTTPTAAIDVNTGIVSATRVYTQGTTFNNQLVNLFEGNNQGGFGGGQVGTNKLMGANTTAVFDLSTNINSQSHGFYGAVFDGRYVYYVPSTTVLITRFDTTLSFSSSASYATYSAFGVSNGAGVFDGRYIYYIPIFLGDPITRYDTTASFTSLSSYASFNLIGINSNGGGVQGAMFDGRYVYFCNATGTQFRYDTTSSFSATSSYTVFDLSSLVGTNTFLGGTFDGRYVYNVSNPDLFLRYDTTGSFSQTTSYSTVTLSTLVNSNAFGFTSAVFDGRYVYVSGLASTIVRLDTTGSFTVSASYSAFDVSTIINSLSAQYYGSVFDGRYVYYIPNANVGNFVTRYDTVGSFISTASYTTFDTSTVNSLSILCQGAVFDGRYIYLSPSGSSLSGVVTRLDAYPGQPAVVTTASQFPNGLSIGTSVGAPSNGLLVSGSVGIGTSAPTATLDVSGIVSANHVQVPGTTFFNQSIALSEGADQGGFGGGSVGTQKSLNALNMSIVNVASFESLSGFFGSVFDGRYLYAISNFIMRYDTTLPFSSSSSYAFYSGGFGSYYSAGFDGRYIYFSPQTLNQFLRYDTTLSFTSPSAYTIFDQITYINSLAGLFQGIIFDGRYIYYMPVNFNSLIRYDTTLSFSLSSSYQIFDQNSLPIISANPSDFYDGAFDGRYVYFIPASYPPVFLRYDTTLDFSQTSSYSAYDLSVLNSHPMFFMGGIYDGRYIYLVTQNDGGVPFLRYDTQGPFQSPSSYTLVLLSVLVDPNARNFSSGTFDGRYIYLTPQFNAVIVRYDTTASFTKASSYSVLASSGLNYNSSIYDGKYVYFLGINGNSTIIRVDAYSGPQANLMTASQAPNSFTVGSLAGSPVAANNLLVGGAVGIGTSNPTVAFSAENRIINAQQQAQAAFTTQNNQEVALFEGNNQSGFGGGLVGTMKTMSSATTLVFDTAAYVDANSRGFSGGVFDGRYIYFVPSNFGSSQYGQITRYDTTLNFSSSASYSVISLTGITGAISGYLGGIFDGQYIYYIPYNNSGSVNSQIVRYDATLPFSLSSSYFIYDTGAGSFAGAVFDGRYLYFVPYQSPLGTAQGKVTRYDTTLSFTDSASYISFTLTGASNLTGYVGGLFDGRYVYFVPNMNPTIAAQFVRYDTTLPFATGSSYQNFDLRANLNTNSAGFWSGVFDGRYIYLVPNTNGLTANGQITRYDTTLSFSTSSSYALFDTATLSTFSVGFQGGQFDGRYVYFVPNSANTTFSGQITRYDTTLPFSTGSSYSLFNTASAVNSLSVGFRGAVFDGRYVYLVPNSNENTYSGLITRLDAYPGPQALALNAASANNGLTLLGGGNIVLTATTTTGSASSGGAAIPATVAGYLTISINGSTQKIAFFNN